MTFAASVAERLGALQRVDQHVVDAGRHVDVTFLLEVGTDPYLVTVQRGRVTAIAGGSLVMPRWAFALRADAEEWERFWDPDPRPGSNDLFAMLRRKVLRVEGDLHPFMANLFYFKALLSAPRTGGLAA